MTSSLSLPSFSRGRPSSSLPSTSSSPPTSPPSVGRHRSRWKGRPPPQLIPPPPIPADQLIPSPLLRSRPLIAPVAQLISPTLLRSHPRPRSLRLSFLSINGFTPTSDRTPPSASVTPSTQMGTSQLGCTPTATASELGLSSPAISFPPLPISHSPPSSLPLRTCRSPLSLPFRMFRAPLSPPLLRGQTEVALPAASTRMEAPPLTSRLERAPTAAASGLELSFSVIPFPPFPPSSPLPTFGPNFAHCFGRSTSPLRHRFGRPIRQPEWSQLIRSFPSASGSVIESPPFPPSIGQGIQRCI